MEKEREILTKQYFPELRVLCEQSGLSFVPIDLRWGEENDPYSSISIHSSAQASRSRTRKMHLSFICVFMKLSAPISSVQAQVTTTHCILTSLTVGFYAQRYGWNGTGDALLMKNYERAKDVCSAMFYCNDH